MTLEQDFVAAQERIKKVSRTPANTELLRLYALFKQGTVGNLTAKRPGMLDVRGRAKHDAWAACAGMAQEDAMRAYVELVDRICGAPQS